jgi:hypothetical protein
MFSVHLSYGENKRFADLFQISTLVEGQLWHGAVKLVTFLHKQ